MDNWNSKSSKRIKLDTSANIKKNKMSSLNKRNVVKRKCFSCWDPIEWLNDAKEYTFDRIYVNFEILEWIVQYIDDYLLDDNIRASVTEVYHHNLNGQVYLIKFYQHHFNPRSENKVYSVLASLKTRLKYKMPWKKNPSYFLRMDSSFDNRIKRIKKELKEENLLDCFKTTQLDVNWLYIPKIEMYEFFEYLTQDEKIKVDVIFARETQNLVCLYLCHQFEWHHHDDVDVDTLAMDICAEEWRRFNLLNDFQIEDILNLDIANKDYHYSYFNEYLDMHLDMLLKIALPQLSTDINDKFEFPVYRLPFNLSHYFVSKFYNKMCIQEDQMVYYCDILSVYDIPTINKKLTKLYLRGNQSLTEALAPVNMRHIENYKISNYIYLSQSLLRSILNNNQTEIQTISIKFDKEFDFIRDMDENITPLDNCTRTFGTKIITIEFEDVIEYNSDKVAKLVKYLINLFKNSKLLNVEVSIKFINCILDDYSFLENIENCIAVIRLYKMNFSYNQLKTISFALKNQISDVDFEDCADMTDIGVMVVFGLQRLVISGVNSCTPLIFFLMAEHLMSRENVDTIKCNRFIDRMVDCSLNFDFDFDLVEFVKKEDKIVALNCNSKEIIDLNNIIKNDSLGYDNMYKV